LNNQAKTVLCWSRQESHELIDGNIRSAPLRYDLDEIKKPDRKLVLKFSFGDDTITFPLNLLTDGLVDAE
jgi:hypothetical protein